MRYFNPHRWKESSDASDPSFYTQKWNILDECRRMNFDIVGYLTPTYKDNKNPFLSTTYYRFILFPSFFPYESNPISPSFAG